jgi:hypothetical protein
MRPLEQLSQQDLLHLLKVESNKLNKAVQRKRPVEELLTINNMIIEIASELMIRIPRNPKKLILDK